jgi:hypothetical protein
MSIIPVVKLNKYTMKIIWYPGSAYASEAWAKYLQDTFKGLWFYSDMNDYTEWSKLSGKRMKINTLDPLPDEIIRQEINTLIISRHSGLRTFEEINQSGILTSIAPQKFIYDPGTSRIGDIEQHLNEIDLFKERGYILNKIVVLPHLEHQYCQYNKTSVQDLNTTE